MGNPGSKVVVLDSWAMMAFLDGEPAAQEVRQILRKARKKQVFVLFSLINYGECLYVVEREQGLQQAQHAIGIIDQLPVDVVPVDRSQCLRPPASKRGRNGSQAGLGRDGTPRSREASGRRALPLARLTVSGGRRTEASPLPRHYQVLQRWRRETL